MGSKTLIRLLIALLVIGGIAAALKFTGANSSIDQVEESTDKKKVLPDFPINDVAEITIQQSEGSITLTKGESSWEVKERDGYPANAEKVFGLLRDVWDLDIVKPMAIGPSQFGRLGLVAPAEAAGADEAATVITFNGADGAELRTLWLGKVYERNEGRPDPFGGGMATTDAGRYVRPDGGNRVFLVDETFGDTEPVPADWLSEDFFKVEDIQSIAITSGTPTDDWKLTRDEAFGDFTLVDAKESEELDQTKVGSMKSAFSNPQLEDVFVGDEIAEKPTDKSTFVITTFDGFTYTIKVGEKNETNELPLSLEVTGNFPEEREVGEEESDEEKERLDTEFAEDIASRKEKLAMEQKLAGHVFKVRSYLTESITKTRAEILAEPEEEETGAEAIPGVPGGEEIAPGITLPGLPPAPAPQSETESESESESE